MEPSTDFSAILPSHVLDQKVREWLLEDVHSYDFAGLVVGEAHEEAVLLCKSPGVLSGVPFVNAVFRMLNCEIEWHYPEGQTIEVLTHIATVKGAAKDVLIGERLSLNILSRASGIATQARHLQDVAKRNHWGGCIAGTRKTTPGFRIVEKYSLLVGGAGQHRNDLSSMVMLKDNHIWAADGDITKAVTKAREACGFSQKIEVECRSAEDARQAANAGAEIIMLDNFGPAKAKKDAAGLKKSFPHLTIEVSGAITPETMSDYFSQDIDVISMSRLTQGYPCVDFSMKIRRAGRDPTNPQVNERDQQ